MEAGLALGSNLGDRLGLLKEAKKRILAIEGVSPVAQSRIYETGPVDVPGEFADMPFLNSVLVIETAMPVEKLAGLLKSIELDMGRVPSAVRNSPRPIDIDLVYAGMLHMKTRALEIPHPRWAIRRFVVQPLADVRPALRIPGQSGSVTDVLAALKGAGGVELFADEW